VSADDTLYIGFDFETSGVNVKEHAPIQVGLAIGTVKPVVFSSLIGGWNWLDSPWTEDIPAGAYMHWDNEAAEVHGISKESLLGVDSPGKVDGWASLWLSQKSHNTYLNQRIAVGWNVAGFDFPFAKRWLPETAGLLSYRTVDLNAVVFYISETTDWEYAKLKAYVKEIAADRISKDSQCLYSEENWHDAGYDALSGLYVWEELQTIGRQGIAAWTV
jgi:hypothetical protein